MTVTATSRLARSANVTVSAKPTKTSPTRPPTNASGTNTATVVSVDAVMAGTIWLVPTITASSRGSPSSSSRWMFSVTTIASSITRAAATERAPRVRMLSVMPCTFISTNATRSDSGIETPVTSVARTLRRNSRIISTARTTPSTASRASSPTASSISGAWLTTSSTAMPSGTSTSANASVSASTVSTVLAPWARMTSTTIAGPAVEAADRLPGAALGEGHGRDVAEGHGSCARDARDQGQGGDLLDRVDGGGDPHGEQAAVRGDAAHGDRQLGGRQRGRDVRRGQAGVDQPDGVDDDGHDLGRAAVDHHVADALLAFERRGQLAGDEALEGQLVVAGHRHRPDREGVRRDALDPRRGNALRQVGGGERVTDLALAGGHVGAELVLAR